MEEADKDWMMRMVGGWVFLLVRAHPGSPGQRAVKRLLLLLLLLLCRSWLKMHSTGMPEFGATILIGVSSYGTLGHVRPSTSNSLIFSVHFRTASLTVAFVRLPLQICLYSASAATVVQSQIPELFHCIVSCHYETNNFRVVLSPPVMHTRSWRHHIVPDSLAAG